ncbi:hypothetical protein BASA50_003179 [Batrachochytrium salamandrivorans]|uniref:Uncharacterized protein n=1 Tax=Batrachochytrium salamandrivorans TaxID=1357716 RepID=A0ABQ8FJ98_9FUNG|nr:hypothetical protein BASA50_003179 [Batrachochytrium salamandrivorans]
MEVSLYGGITMAASAHDGDNHIILIAIGLYDIENEMNWRHFSLKLAETIPEIKQPELSLFMTGRKASNKLRDKFSHFRSSPYVFGTSKKNVNTIFKSKFGGQIWAAAKASSQVKHNEAMAIIAAINCDAAEYLKNAIQRGGQEAISLFLDLEQSL